MVTLFKWKLSFFFLQLDQNHHSFFFLFLALASKKNLFKLTH
ncbi:hypothetical protein Cabys_1315 [Caldithrix abyssi DSM 13497]|uniref:Uncharacterized protein n=1 Tax=Caldithrix abyssi DSM 13497 TaxID=880073 RepID=A0A1J1C822_CALAY|nr:hypothetical protein Cabys_1315 [Caldithrix abyssi DSM 13497]